MTVQISTGDIQGLSTPVVEFLLAGESDFLAALRHQFAHAKIAKITEDGYGFYIDYETDPTLRILNPKLQNKMISGVAGVSDHGECICTFTLFLDEGLVFSLEGCPFIRDAWTNEVVTLKYINTDIDGNEYFASARNQRALKSISFLKR